MMKARPDVRITDPWGIPFFRDRPDEAIARLAEEGGLLVAPSGPGLATVESEPVYAEALKNADIVLADSGFMVLCWRWLHGVRIPRISGYLLLNRLLTEAGIDWGADSLWVMPDTTAAGLLRQGMRKTGVLLPDEAFYIAPMYDPAAPTDPALEQMLRRRPVHWVMIQVGGGVQEPLGDWLKRRNLPHRPAIVCTGAASAFLFGGQVRIPWWADRLYLGWLFRVCSRPGVYGRRYARAVPLLFSLYREHKRLKV